MLSGPSATPQVALVGATLPHVAAAPPVVLPAEEAVATDDVERIVQHLSERHTGLSRREIRSVARTIVEECESHGVDLHIVLGVIHVESAGYHRAVSPVGAIGLMQIMPATGEQLAREHGVEWYGPATLFDPIVNVRLGIAYLHELSDRYDHMPTALAAYNWGPGSIDRRIRRGARMPKIYVEQVRRAVDKVEQAEIGRASS
jgi:soluble lytic murein transglycosylase